MEYKNLLHLVTKNREKLEATLSPEQAELFEKFYTTVNEMNTSPNRLHLSMDSTLR